MGGVVVALCVVVVIVGGVVIAAITNSYVAISVEVAVKKGPSKFPAILQSFVSESRSFKSSLSKILG